MTDVIEQRKKARVALPIDRLELDLRRVQPWPDEGIEEVWTGVIVLEHTPFGIFRHRRQLMHIPDQHSLHTAEGVLATADAPEDEIDRIERVASHHADFID